MSESESQQYQPNDSIYPEPAKSHISEDKQADQSAPFEAIMNDAEMEFLHKLMPKGYTLSSSFRTTRPRVVKYVSLGLTQTEQYIPELKEDQPLLKRLSRPPKDRLRPSEYSYNSHKYTKPMSELVKKCGKVLSMVQKHEYSLPFLKPVDYIALNIPDYPLIVKEPMDLSRVEKKLKTGLYSNPMLFAVDVRKIWSNAILYNPKSSPIYTMTVAIADFFEKLYKEVEENPFQDQTNDYLEKKVGKLEKKMDEIVNFAPGLGNRIESVAYLEKPMTALEKKALSMGIKGLAPESLVGIRDIIIEECPKLAAEGHIEFDLGTLDTRVLRKLERYVKSMNNKAKMDRKLAHRKEMKLKAANDKIDEENVNSR